MFGLLAVDFRFELAIKTVDLVEMVGYFDLLENFAARNRLFLDDLIVFQAWSKLSEYLPVDSMDKIRVLSFLMLIYLADFVIEVRADLHPCV